MTKKRLRVTTAVSAQTLIDTTTIRDERTVGLTHKLVKLTSLSLLCSVLYICTSSAAPEGARKTHKQKSVVSVHRDTYLKSGEHVHEDVPIGTKSYLRNIYIKLGAGAMYYHKFKYRKWGYAEKRPKIAPIYIIGIGRKINDSVRTDLNFQFANLHYKANYLSQIIKTRSAFVNGYYDINHHNNIIPYITAGIGIGSNKGGYLKRYGEPTNKGKDVTNFIWNVGVGAVLKSDKNFGLDLGYRYMHLGHTKTNDSRDDIFDKGGKQVMRGHQVLGSLTYHF